MVSIKAHRIALLCTEDVFCLIVPDALHVKNVCLILTEFVVCRNSSHHDDGRWTAQSLIAVQKS